MINWKPGDQFRALCKLKRDVSKTLSTAELQRPVSLRPKLYICLGFANFPHCYILRNESWHRIAGKGRIYRSLIHKKKGELWNSANFSLYTMGANKYNQTNVSGTKSSILRGRSYSQNLTLKYLFFFICQV